MLIVIPSAVIMSHIISIINNSEFLLNKNAAAAKQQTIHWSLMNAYIIILLSGTVTQLSWTVNTNAEQKNTFTLVMTKNDPIPENVLANISSDKERSNPWKCASQNGMFQP